MNDHIPAEDFAVYVDGMLSAEKKNELESHFSCCPSCLDELVEIVAIMRSRDKVLAGGQGKIPAQFLKSALGEKSKITKPVLHLRLVFEIAAAFVVVVFIGYFFLSNKRFWQTPEKQKLSAVMDKNVRLPEISIRDEEIAPLPAQRRDLADAKKTTNQRTKADADQALSDSFVSEKRENAVAGTGLSTVKGGSVQTRVQENKLKEIAEGQPRPATEKESLQKKDFAPAKAAPQAVGVAQMDFAAKAQTTTPPHFRVEGEVDLSDLRNPEFLSAWYWFPKDLVLELQINGAGTVIAVVPLGKFDQPLAKQAENEARKLLFSVSKKKLRRARLIANELPPN